MTSASWMPFNGTSVSSDTSYKDMLPLLSPPLTPTTSHRRLIAANTAMENDSSSTGGETDRATTSFLTGRRREDSGVVVVQNDDKEHSSTTSPTSFDDATEDASVTNQEAHYTVPRRPIKRRKSMVFFRAKNSLTDAVAFKPTVTPLSGLIPQVDPTAPEHIRRRKSHPHKSPLPPPLSPPTTPPGFEAPSISLPFYPAYLSHPKPDLLLQRNPTRAMLEQMEIEQERQRRIRDEERKKSIGQRKRRRWGLDDGHLSEADTRGSAEEGESDDDFSIHLPAEWMPDLSFREKRPRITWKGTPLDISDMPYYSKLHPHEAHIASVLRLTPEQFLRCKQQLVTSAVEFAQRGQSFRKSDAQKLCRVDVNKTSRLWEVFGEMGWLNSPWRN